LPAGARLAVALTDAVPAGQYARSGLQALGLWDIVADRLAETDNVRAALALVAVGAAPLGVVYATDAAADPRVHIRARFPENSHPAIVYSGAVAAGADSPEAALAFLDWLGGEAGRAILAQHGFVLLAE
jgi:molybdate transport system substrate-binding protein